MPTGQLLMGTPTWEAEAEDLTHANVRIDLPPHLATLPKPFAMTRREVTLGEFRHFVNKTRRVPVRGCTIVQPNAAFEFSAQGQWLNPGYPQRDDHPVTCVSWDDMTGYAHWRSRTTGHRYRMPSEAEWEYAARAGTTTTR